MAVVVTAASGFDLGYVWKNQAGHTEPERSAGGYYINAAQAGEPPGRWWGPGAQALGFSPGQVVERGPYELVYRQIDPRTGEKLGRSRGNYAKFACVEMDDAVIGEACKKAAIAFGFVRNISDPVQNALASEAR